jgi:hypothetical protein
MRKAAFVVMALGFAGLVPSLRASSRWEGVDSTVVEKFAREAGRPPQKPIIDTDRGDLPLFLFLVAGGAGGFVMGYYFRELFPPASKEKKP